MKKRERYKILNYAKEQYSKIFKTNYQFKHLSKKELHNLLKQYKHSSMCEWDYCCYGLYQNCWQEPYQKGIWNYTQKEVDDLILYEIDRYKKYYKKDSRILYCESNNKIEVIIVMRDVCKIDFLITFTNEDY